jgi:hypothetical protein
VGWVDGWVGREVVEVEVEREREEERKREVKVV